MKTFLLTIVLACITSLSIAQWQVGIKGGTAFSNYKTKTPWKQASTMGAHFGATAFKQFSGKYGVSFDLLYIQKGYNHKICNTIYDRLNATYIEIPITLDYAFIIPALRNFKAHANLGIYTAYWVSGKYKTKGFDEGATESFDFDKSKASRFDFGPNVGGRIEYLLSKGSLSLDIRYELGLPDLQKQANDDTRNTNRSFIIGLSYLKSLGF